MLIPLWEIARDNGYDINARNTQHSWRRAADNLEGQGQVQMHWVRPVSPHRRIVTVGHELPCVGAAVGGGVHEIRRAAAIRCGDLIRDWQPLYRD